MTDDTSGCHPPPARQGLSPWGAVALSFFFIGFGQASSGRGRAGVVWLIALVTGLTIVFWLAVSPEAPGLMPAVIGLIVLFLAWLAMLVHAYQFAASKSVKDEQSGPWIAALLSGIIPGIGQIFTGAVIRGLMFIVALICVALLPPIWSLVAGRVLWLVSPLDAYREACRRAKCTDTQFRRLALAAILGQVLALVYIGCVRTFFVQPFKIPTSTMSPTLRGITTEPGGRESIGDHIFVDKLAYRLRTSLRGEIVVFSTTGIAEIPEASRGHYWVKRIVGLPGERVSIHPPFLYINGEKLTSPPVFRQIAAQEDGYSGYVIPAAFPPSKYIRTINDEIHLGPDEYFVLGDNSPRSLDSRFWGPLHRKYIVGRVTKIYWPSDRAGITFSN